MKNTTKKKEIGGPQFHADAVYRLVEKHFKVIRASDDHKEPQYFLDALVRAVAVTGGVQELNDESWEEVVEWIISRLDLAREKTKRVVDESNAIRSHG